MDGFLPALTFLFGGVGFPGKEGSRSRRGEEGEEGELYELHDIDVCGCGEQLNCNEALR